MRSSSHAFDDFSRQYDDWFETHKVQYNLELQAIKELLPEVGEGVEIGAGTGRFSQGLNLLAGLEPSESMRGIARERGVTMVAGLAEWLPFRSCCCDYAFLVTVVCFLDTPEVVFKEVYRILKSGGHIILGLLDGTSKLAREYQRNKHKSRFYKDADFRSVKEIQDILIQVGFGNVEYRQAILPDDICDDSEGEVRQGHGAGSFVVMRAKKCRA